MAVYLIESKLNEDFSPSFPEWLKNNITNNKGFYNYLKSFLNKSDVDMNKADFISTDAPTSSRDPILKDPDKIPIFLLNDGTVYTPKSKSSGEQYVSYKDSQGKVRYNYIKNLSWKTVLGMTKSFGFIDRTDPSNFNTDLKAQRKQAKSGTYDRKKNAQYTIPVYGDKKDRWGTTSHEDDNIVGYDWATRAGYDKSGYPLDPEKYVKKLNELNLDNYAQKLERYYAAIKKTQSELATALTGADIDNTKYRSYSHWSRSNVMTDIKDAADSLERAIDDYRELQRRVTRIVSHEDWDDEKITRYLQDSWGATGKSIYDRLKDASAAIKAINANDSYSDED